MRLLPLASFVFLFTSYDTNASWMEFCRLSGDVVSDIQAHETGRNFEIKVISAKKYEYQLGNEEIASYIDCRDHIGKVYEVRYSFKEYEEAGNPKKGQKHCTSYIIVDFGQGAPVFWEPGCKND